MMLEERTFYLTEAQRGEIYAKLPDAGSEHWQQKQDERIKAVLSREGIEVIRVTYRGLYEGKQYQLRVLVPVISKDDAGNALRKEAVKLEDEEAEAAE